MAETLSASHEIPYKNSKTEFQEHGSQVMSSMLGFILLAGVAWYFLSKYFGKPLLTIKKPTKQLEILDSQRVGTKSSLFLIRCKNKEFLIGLSGETVTLLSEFDSE